MEITVLTSTRITLNGCNGAARRHRTPAHIVHGFYSWLYAELLIFIQHRFVETHIFDIHIIQSFLAVSHSTPYQLELSLIDFAHDHVFETFSAKVMLTARQKSEFFSKQATRANLTIVLFGVKASFKSCLSLLTVIFKLFDVIVLKSYIAIFVLHEFLICILLQQNWHDFVLNLADHFVDSWTILHPYLFEFIQDRLSELLVKFAF